MTQTNFVETQECYLLLDINISWQSKGKELFRNKKENVTDGDHTFMKLTRKVIGGELRFVTCLQILLFLSN